MWISTFHRLCGSILREHGTRSGIRPDFGIADEAEQLNLMRQCMFDASVDIRIWKPQTLVQRMSVLKNMMKDPGSPEAWGKDEHRDRNAILANAYQAVLRKTNRLDFDDMLLGAVRTLHDQPEVRIAVSRRYRHVLIDEGQDTNAPQYMLARLIAQEHHNVFIVGDPDQAIYGWRGAELRNILEPRSSILARTAESSSAPVSGSCRRRHKTIFDLASSAGSGGSDSLDAR